MKLYSSIIPVMPTDCKFKLTTDEPLQVIPDHTEEQGSVLVNPLLVHDHIVFDDIDSILVAAINPHKASSWGVVQIVEGRCLTFTDVKHNGVHITDGFEVLLAMCKVVIVVTAHKLNGIDPKILYQHNM